MRLRLGIRARHPLPGEAACLTSGLRQAPCQAVTWPSVQPHPRIGAQQSSAAALLAVPRQFGQQVC
jgi:hypothetical protein